MRHQLFLSILFLVLNTSDTLRAQTFGAAAVFGINAAQIQGDDLAGYNKLGIHAGLRGIIRLTDRTQFSTGILYSEQGSQSRVFAGNLEAIQKISLNYIEVPLLFSFLDWEEPEFNYYRIHFQGGLSYGRLLRAAAENSNYTDIAERELFAKNSVNYTFGATYMINSTGGATIRYSRTFHRVYDRRKYEDDPSIPEVNSLIPYWLTFRLEVMF